MIEAGIILRAKEAFLDGPAQPGGSGQFRKCRIRSGICEVIRDSPRVTQTAAGKQPSGKTFSSRIVERHPGPVMEPVSLGAFTRAERLPILGRQFCNHCGGVGLNKVPLVNKPQAVG